MTRPRWLLVVAAVAVAALVAVIAVATGTGDDDSPTGGTTTPDSPADGGDGDGATTDGRVPPGQTDAPTVDFRPLPPVAVGEPADLGGGLVATVTSVESTDLEARAPGETAGPGVLVTVEVRNDTGDDVELGGFAINASHGSDATPAIPHQTGPIEVLRGTLEPGDTASGTYAFRLPEEEMDSLVIDLHHSAAEAYMVVEVEGAVS